MTSLRGHQCGGRSQAQALDLFVDLGFLLDVQVVARHVGFGLVIIIVRDEVRDGILREKILELSVKLGRQRFIMRHDERGLLQLLDDGSDRESFAGAGRT